MSHRRSTAAPPRTYQAGIGAGHGDDGQGRAGPDDGPGARAESPPGPPIGEVPHHVGTPQEFEGSQLRRGELEGADIETLLEGVVTREAELAHHLAVQRRQEEADPVRLRQNFGRRHRSAPGS